MRPRHWPPGERERLRGTNGNQRGKEGRKERQRDRKGSRSIEKQAGRLIQNTAEPMWRVDSVE